MDDQDWLVTVGQGVLMPSVINYLFQKMSLNDWVIYNRDFGRPLVDAVTNAAKGTQEWNDASPHLQAGEKEYDVVDVEAARADGVLPIPWH